MARAMGTDEVQGHNSGGGRIISPLLASQGCGLWGGGEEGSGAGERWKNLRRRLKVGGGKVREQGMVKGV